MDFKILKKMSFIPVDKDRVEEKTPEMEAISNVYGVTCPYCGKAFNVVHCKPDIAFKSKSGAAAIRIISDCKECNSHWEILYKPYAVYSRSKTNEIDKSIWLRVDESLIQ